MTEPCHRPEKPRPASNAPVAGLGDGVIRPWQAHPAVNGIVVRFEDPEIVDIRIPVFVQIATQVGLGNGERTHVGQQIRSEDDPVIKVDRAVVIKIAPL